MSNFALPLLSGWRDVVDGGNYRVAGTVKMVNTPGAYRVRLFSKVGARLIREQWAREDGEFSFDNIAFREYFVVSHDHTGTYNAVISDSIFPVEMP